MIIKISIFAKIKVICKIAGEWKNLFIHDYKAGKLSGNYLEF